MKPDELLFRSHLEGAAFQSAVDAGKWGLLGVHSDIQWPTAIIWVAADTKIVPLGKVFLRFNLDQYPVAAPTACPWDNSANSKLAANLYPKLQGKFKLVFRTDWENGDALYCPLDRRAMAGHDTWKQTFPYWWWTPQFTIMNYLEFVHLCLNPPLYEEAAA